MLHPIPQKLSPVLPSKHFQYWSDATLSKVYKIQTNVKTRTNDVSTHLLPPLPHRVQGIIFLVRHERDAASRSDFLCSLLPVEEEQMTTTGLEPKPLGYGERCISVVIFSINVSTCDTNQNKIVIKKRMTSFK